MPEFVKCQQNLLALAKQKGFLTFDDILDAASTSLLSASDIDRLSNNLQSQGVMLVETAPEQLSSEITDITDYSRTDYDVVFSEVLALSENLTPLINTVKEIPPPQYGEIQTLAEQLQYENEFARERLILLHLRVAIKIALSIAKQYSYDIEDAVSASFIGLVEAVEHFDLNGFSAFLSYASMWIQQNIHRFCTPVWMEYYCPTHIREKMFPVLLKHNANNGTLICENGFDPDSIVRIADDLGFSEEQVEKYLLFAFNQIAGHIDINTLLYSDEEYEDPKYNDEILSYICDNVDLYERIANKNLAEVIPTILSSFNPREREIIRMRFGFEDGSPKTLEEVGQKFNITRERVRQIETKCIRKLRHPTRAKKIKDFYY